MDKDAKLPQLFDLTGKVAFVTGGARGIGKAICLRLAEAGAHVAIADLDDDGALKTRAMIDSRASAGAPGSAEVIRLDVTNPTDVTRAIDGVAAARGRLDLLVNNAGIYPMKPFAEADDALWLRTLEINVMGAVRCARAALPHFDKAGGGAVVNVASIASFRAHGDMVHYDTSKGGVLMFTRSLAWEVRGRNIRVNAVAPGGINTPGTMAKAATTDPAQQERLRAMGAAYFGRVALGRMGQSDEVARAVLFLCTPLAAYVTGAVLPVDGGYLVS